MRFVHNYPNLLMGLPLGLLIVLVQFVTMPKNNYAGDPMASQMATVSLINEGTLEIPTFVLPSFPNPGQYFYKNSSKNKIYSKYGIMNTFMYLPPLLLEKWYRGTLEYDALSKDRTFFLNLYYIALSLLISLFLFKLLAFYSHHLFIKYAFILMTFYATFLWNHLRTQTFEIFHVLFFLAFFYYFIKFKNRLQQRGSSHSMVLDKNLFLSLLFLTFLCLSKLVFILIFPIICLFIPLSQYRSSENIFKYFAQKVWDPKALSWVLPMIAALVLILLVNDTKFGSPFETGYEQGFVHQSLFSGDMRIAIFGFLFNTQRSIFLHFPVLVVALFGMKTFYKNYSLDFLLIVSIFTLFFFVFSSFVSWSGEACYGPRYLLAFLPVLSLPIIEVMKQFWNSFKQIKTKIYIGLIASLMGYSLFLQINVISLNYFIYYDLYGVLSSVQYETYGQEDDIKKYMNLLHFGQINQDLILYKMTGKSFLVLDKLQQLLSPEDFESISKEIRAIIRYNFWFHEP